MDDRLAAAPVVVSFAEAVRPVAGVVGFYVGGSLAFGDFQPGVSDLDLVAVIEKRLGVIERRRLTALHRSVVEADPSAGKLHCAYVPRDEVAGLDRKHLTWAHGELYRRAVSGVARAELLRNGIVVYGPPPADLLPALDEATLRSAALAELSGYWTGAVGKPHLWLQDVYVDLGLTTLARVEATVAEDRLITKTEAIGRLHRFAVPAELADQIARRRRGEAVALTDDERRDRGETVRRLVAAGIDRLLAEQN
jgi:hypothetical protein